MHMTTITTAAHVAHLDGRMGTGVLVLPHLDNDLWLALSSLHEVDFHAMQRELAALGFSIVSDDDGLWHTAGHLPDGREVVTLASRAEDDDEIDLDDLARSIARLQRSVGLMA